VRGVKVTLSSGDAFYMDCDLEQAALLLVDSGLVQVGHRYVNPEQVAQLTWEVIPSIESPERLQEVV
jgi:hypothetical protein